MNGQHVRQSQMVADWLTLWELGQARAALRRMGEELPVAPARSREAFADAIYALADTDFQRGGVVGPAAEHPHLRVLPGGEESPLAGGSCPRGAAEGQLPRHGDRPLRVVAKQPGAHPTTDFDREGDTA